MEASPNQVIQFFNGFKQSVIPLFQRPYEWRERNWEILWNDILERYEAPRDTSHFLGTIVSMPSRSVPIGVSKHLIIDGQQRLTTIALLLCAIRDELPEIAETERSRIQKYYLTNEGYPDWDYLKLLPTQDDRGSFRELVASGTRSDSDLIGQAYAYFRQQIKGTDSDGNPLDVNRILETVERRLIIVSINLGEYDDPYLIFESLNAKGSPLTQADLVRNYFLMRLPINEQESVYRSFWLPMQRRLGDSLTEFIRHYLMRDGEEVLRGDVYSELKQRLQDSDEDQVKQVLGDMHRLSEHYLKLIKPDEETDPDLQENLNQLLNWEVTTAYPIALKLYDSFSRNRITKQDLNACLQTIESFVVRRVICAVPTNQLKRMFLQAAKDYRDENPLPWLESVLTSGNQGRRWPNDAEFSDAWLRYKAYAVPRRCRLILEALEDSYAHKEPALLSSATIEHVLPETMTTTWKQMLGPDAETMHEIWAHTIGNLTLTAYNSELSNMFFEDKKRIYAESHYSLNSWFAHCDKWTGTEIQKRARELFQKAKQIWPHPSRE